MLGRERNEQDKRRWRLAFTAMHLLHQSPRFLPLQESPPAPRRAAPPLALLRLDRRRGRPVLPRRRPQLPKAIANAVKAKSLQGFADRFGGVKELAGVLEADVKLGICTDTDAEFKRPRSVFGTNEYRKPRGRSFLSLTLLSCFSWAARFCP